MIVPLASPPPAPARFPSPFDPEPVPLARAAADELLTLLRTGIPGVDMATLAAPGGGKMFGVLVVADEAGRIGTLRAFSGMLDGRWFVDGFAPPLFDPARRDAFWPAAEAELAALLAQHEALTAQLAPLESELAALVARNAAARAALRAIHATRKAARAARRAAVPGTGAAAAVPGTPAAEVPGTLGAPDAVSGTHPADVVPGTHTPRGSPAPVPGTHATLHALAQESRADTAELRRLDAAHRAAEGALAARIGALTAERAALEAHRAARSRHFWDRIVDGYVVPDARGVHRPLSALFAPHVPPGGAGDCAAPKLLAAAYRAGLRPLALAELWWGAPPVTGGRHAGHFYPACRGKCGPILGHMLGGLDADPAPVFGTAPIAADAPRIVHADRWLVIVDKPAGLLSVPGRHAALKDSVLARMRRRYPGATGPLVVHRLDLDTSGLLVIALDDDTHAAMQRLFARREVSKRYLAILAGEVAADRGTIELPLRVDLDDRPRQIVDPVHGKPAITDFEVLDRSGGRTRVALYPRTGRTHQLRVHCAHPDGLGAPILGDRLYGAVAAERLHLHAEHLAFTHPHTGDRLSHDSPAPF
jgi:tRNA pseudouridine32 synthase/23S rRNA pseudouridine746 synthase